MGNNNLLLWALLIDYSCTIVLKNFDQYWFFIFEYRRNLSPADADYNLLDVARRLEMYGVILYPAKVKHCSIELLLLK